MAKHDEYTKRQIALLGQRIKKLRKELGYTNHETFAYEKEIGRSQYGGYEIGKDMRFSSLLRVLNALGISLEEFFSEGFEGTKDED
ncbi:MAG: helix-turn-helix transcriptional regulator [Bacteroidota bacterium]